MDVSEDTDHDDVSQKKNKKIKILMTELEVSSGKRKVLLSCLLMISKLHRPWKGIILF